MSDNPLISVIVLTWCDPIAAPEELGPTLIRRSEHVPKMLRGLRQKAGIDHELIIVSNGSRGHNRWVLEASEHRDVHADKLLLLGDNIGTAWGRHEGTKIATGDYLCFLDDDFDFTEGWLDSMYSLASAYDAVVSGHKWPRAPINSEHAGYINVPWPSDNCMILHRRHYEETGGYSMCPPCRARRFLQALADRQAQHPFLIPKPEPCVHWGAELSVFFRRESNLTWRLMWKGPDELGVDPAPGPR